MANELTLSKSSINRLEKDTALEKYFPSIDNISSIADFDRFRLENLAAGLFRERVYMVMVGLINSDLWRDITTLKVSCYECGTISVTKELKEVAAFYSEEGDLSCPVCKSTFNIAHEAINAFDVLDDFYNWVQQELGVTKRTITMRKEYLDRVERLGVEPSIAFAGLVKWGVEWMRFARLAESAVVKESLSLDEAKNLMTNYEAFPDKSAIMRLMKVMEEKDDIEMVAVPYSSDFVINVASPDGIIKHSTYYMAIPIKDDEVKVVGAKFWDSNFGMMIARRLKINAPLSYEAGLKFTPNFNFYKISYYRNVLLQPMKNLASFFLKRVDKLPQFNNDFKDEKAVDTLERLSNVGALTSITHVLQNVQTLVTDNELASYKGLTSLIINRMNEWRNGKANEVEEEYTDIQ